MPRHDPFGCFSGGDARTGTVKAPSREKPQQQIACDRCRGQKLRCIRGADAQAPCERCQKAGATCIIDSSVRMGRPRGTDTDQSRDTGGSSHHPSHQACPPPMPTTTSSHSTTSVDFSPTSDPWMVYDLDDLSIAPTLRNGPVQYLDVFDISVPEGATLEDGSVGVVTENNLDPTLELASDQSGPAPTAGEATTLDASNSLCDHNRFPFRRFPLIRHETMQELSDLNMQLSRAVLSRTNKYANSHLGPGRTTPPDETRTVYDAVVFMMDSLQTYHRLLVEILGAVEPTRSDMYDAHVTSRPSTAPNRLLSPIEGTDAEASGEHTSRATGRPPRKRLRSGSSAASTALHDLSHSIDLDMPTSLLLLSCHTNLIHFCRDAFATVRETLLTTPHQITLFTISSLKVDGLSIPPDPDLQIIVLIQAVIRMVDRIGRLLSYPDDCEVDFGGERCESNASGCAIPRRLLELVLRNGTSAEDPTDGVGTEALRGVIRGVHELVYMSV